MSRLLSTSVPARLIAAALGLAMAFAFAGSASSQSMDDQIADLLAQIASLQAQLLALQGGSSSSVCPYTWAVDLSSGSTGADVLNLQKFLNSDPATQLASSGAGSPGSETSFFGPITAGGVSKFQEKYASEVLTPLGLPSGTGYYGPSSRAKANSLCAGALPSGDGDGDGGVTTGGTEGSLTVTQRSSPSNGTDVKKGQEKAVVAYKIKAEDSDMNVQRMDLLFSVRPWLYLESISVWDGGTLIREVSGLSSSDFTELTAGSSYRLRMSALGANVPEGTDKVLTVKVKVLSITDRTAATITITMSANGIRGVDTSGLNHEEPSAALTRTWDYLAATVGTVASSLNPDTPDTRVVDVTDTGETENVELMRFDLKAENQNAAFDSIAFTIQTSGAGVVQLFSNIWLANASGNEVASVDAIATSSVITGLDPDEGLAKDVKTTFRLMATVADLDDFDPGDAASSTLTTAGFLAEDANFEAITALSSAVTGNDLHFYKNAPVFAFVSGSVTGIDDGSGSVKKADAAITFTVTAQDDAIYLLNFANGGVVASSTPALATTTGTFTNDDSNSTAKTNSFEVKSGQTAQFTFSARLDNTTSGLGDAFFQLAVSSFAWNTVDLLAGATTFTFGLDDFEAPQVFLED